jgi:hypothetical protein
MSCDLLEIIKANLPPEVTAAPDDGSQCPLCVCRNMDPETLKRDGECGMCKLWRRSDYRAAWKDRKPDDVKTQPAPPSFARKAVSFVKAVVRHAADGFERVTDEALAARLATCGTCEHHIDGSCTLCGCGLAIKATWRSESCPKGKWAKQE